MKQESFPLDMRKNFFPCGQLGGGPGCPGIPCSVHPRRFLAPSQLTRALPRSLQTWIIWWLHERERLYTVTVWQDEGHITPMSNVFKWSLTGGTTNKHFYTECLGGCYKPGAVIHDSDAGSTGQLLMCFIASLVVIFILKLQMEILCQK